MEVTQVPPSNGNAVNVEQLFSQRGRITLQLAILQGELQRIDSQLAPFIQGQPLPK